MHQLNQMSLSSHVAVGIAVAAAHGTVARPGAAAVRSLLADDDGGMSQKEIPSSVRTLFPIQLFSLAAVDSPVAFHVRYYPDRR